MNKKSTYTLNNGVEIPVIGFGTWQTPDGEIAEQSVLDALEAGYTHIDTAAIYGNEESVGRAIKKSGIPRKSLFVTTKLWNTEHGYEQAKAALDVSLKKLGLDYLDLYLIHWPNPIHVRDTWKQANADAWRAMEEAVAEGKVRAIGISNFRTHHIDALLESATVIPAVNQIYLNPSDMQADVLETNKRHGILTEAYSPLGTGKIFEIQALQEIAASYQRTVAQVVLRWSLQHGFLPLPKSVHTKRIQENLDVFDFELTPEDMALLDGLHGQAGTAVNPDETQF